MTDRSPQNPATGSYKDREQSPAGWYLSQYDSWTDEQLFEDDLELPLVCVTHQRFIPCRADDDSCYLSSEIHDIDAVTAYQRGDE